MPELPEVETVRRRLAERLEHRTIESIDVFDDRFCLPDSPEIFVGSIVGSTIDLTDRRGKYLIWHLSNGRALVMHLRMTGTLLYDPDCDQRHSRVEFGLDDGHRLVFSDPRRFGTGIVVDESSLDGYFENRLGLEPFDSRFDAGHLFQLTRRRSTPIKSFLLDQRQIAGIGNIYADEALFRARINPLRLPQSITRTQAAALRESIIDALSAGIDAGGATIDDFRDPDGAWGAYQSEFLVHRREGRPCPACSEAIVRIVVAGRSTYYCPSCQPKPRKRR